MRYRLVYLLSFIVVVSLGFYACGDDDSSSTSLTPTAAQTKAAANNAPRSGSVIQGSRAENGVTADVVTINDDGSVSVEGVDSAAFESSGIPSPGSIVSGFYSYTDGAGDEWGMFVDGEETIAADIPGSDTCYSGDAVVYYDVTDADGTVATPRRLTGEVTLEFGQGDNSISGEITGIDPDVSVTLSEASPDADSLYSATTVLQNVPGAGGDGEGQWGVQFFNDGDDVVLAGTWGGTVDSSDGALSSSAVGVLVVRPTECSEN